jgi:hypothetical protein
MIIDESAMIILQKINKVKDISRMCVIFSAQLGNTDLQPDIQSQDGSKTVHTRKTVIETSKKTKRHQVSSMLGVEW